MLLHLQPVFNFFDVRLTLPRGFSEGSQRPRCHRPEPVFALFFVKRKELLDKSCVGVMKRVGKSRRENIFLKKWIKKAEISFFFRTFVHGI